jgi:hypothetical protein
MGAARVRPGSTQELEDNLDKIDAGLVGCLKVNHLRNLAPRALRPTLNLVADGQAPPDTSNMPKAATAEETRRTLDRKGHPKGGPLGTMESYVVTRLYRNQLYEPLRASLPVNDLVPEGGERFVRAGMFFVKKSNGKLRIITDARSANALMTTEGHDFELFSLEALRGVISSVSTNDAWYAVNVDLRHWFHQIPLPDRLKRLFVLCPRDSDAPYVLKATPMGWLLAPAIGQCASWSMLLASPAKGPWTAAKSDLTAEDLESIRRAPPWMPLQGGGGIFIVLDNILVVTPNRATAVYWARRVERQASEFGAVIKTEEDRVGPRKVDVITLTREAGSFEFLGVVWQHGSRQIKKSEDEQMPGDPNGMTYRQLASVMGKLLWFHRVNDTKMYGPDMLSLRKIYEIATPSDDDWESSAPIDAGRWSTLQHHWTYRLSAGPTPYEPLAAWSEPLCAAVDASGGTLSGSVHSRIGVVGFDGSCEAPEPTAREVVSVRNAGHGEPIAVSELRAIIMGCRTLLARNDPCGLIIIATDSQNAKCWAEKQYANNDIANKLLAELYQALEGRRLYLVYVPTAANVADDPSRSEKKIDAAELDRAKLKETWKYVQRAHKEAKGMWRHGQSQVGGLPPRAVVGESAVEDKN